MPWASKRLKAKPVLCERQDQGHTDQNKDPGHHQGTTDFEIFPISILVASESDFNISKGLLI
jgi:hypothetical protein